jgi:GntR family transcriptional regulator/MocR family aminotransferase
MVSDWATSAGLDLLLELDQRGGRRAAIEASLRTAIGDGRLAPGTRLPSSRALAADVGVARGTVAGAYDQLVAEGWLAARRGSGTAVAWTPAEGRGGGRSGAEDGDELVPRFDFRPGSPDVSTFPRREWVAAVRRALRDGPDATLRYSDERGLARTREMLSAYVGRTRGVRSDANNIVVCNGFTQALALLVAALRELGATHMALEDPCIPLHRDAVLRAAMTVTPLPVDADGADPTFLPAAEGAGAAFITPAHQYPMGATLAPARRAAFTAWARDAGAYVIEDDYDGEFRYDRQPVGALQAMDPEHVVYVGTASKSLAPGLRLGWMVLPDALVGPVVAAKELADRHSSALDQLALAELIRSGALDRHVRRSRLRYRRRRDALVAGLATLPTIRTGGIAAGLHTVLRLVDDGPPEAEVVERLAAAGVAVHPLGRYWHQPPGPAKGLVVGFGTPAEHAFAASLDALIAALR